MDSRTSQNEIFFAHSTATFHLSPVNIHPLNLSLSSPDYQEYSLPYLFQRSGEASSVFQLSLVIPDWGIGGDIYYSCGNTFIRGLME